jgi:cytochrome oxidase Cu insertion factor (SCO1/SenC/PrrC family)
MTGMGSPAGSGDASTVSAFHHALSSQGALIVVFAAVVLVAWNQLRSMQYRRAVQRGETFPPPLPARPAEPAARRFLRIAFGLFWVFDGLLQLQSAMPTGLAGSVIEPSAATSPSWVRHLVDVGTTVWRDHPSTAAASVVWIQLGVGFLLLVAPRGLWSRGAGLVSVGWGLVVWAFGEAFGGILAPGLTVLFGAPGGVVFYVVAGGLIALPEIVWSGRRLGRIILGSTGVFLLAFALLQAWPGRGFWQGTTAGRPGTLAAMVGQMAETPQPHPLSSMVASFESFDGAHGWGVNLFAVVAMAAIGLVFLGGSGAGRRLLFPAIVAFAVLCAVDWILIEDFGFWGGLGTDPNSMPPLLAVAVTGYLGIDRPAQAGVGADDEEEKIADADPSPAMADDPPVPEPIASDEAEPQLVSAGAVSLPSVPPKDPSARRSWWEQVDPRYAARVAAAVASIAIVLIGAAPMAAATVNRTADPSVTEADNGPPSVVDGPAPGFNLTDPDGTPVSLGDLRGHTVVLTFLDPVCTTDCPIIAQELRVTNSMLGSVSADVRFVAVVANPVYRSPQVVVAFNHQEGLDTMANWTFLTGSTDALQAAWNAYGISVESAPAGGMVVHSDVVFVIDARGRLRRVVNADPGADTASSQSSFSGLLTSQIHQVLHQ